MGKKYFAPRKHTHTTAASKRQAEAEEEEEKETILLSSTSGTTVADGDRGSQTCPQPERAPGGRATAGRPRALVGKRVEYLEIECDFL